LKKSDVFVSIDVLKGGKTKTPIARVLNGTTPFILIMKGGKMPLSNNFAARVPLVSGNKKKIEKNLPNCVGLFMTMIF
jgi:cell division protein FtsQ